MDDQIARTETYLRHGGKEGRQACDDKIPSLGCEPIGIRSQRSFVIVP